MKEINCTIQYIKQLNLLVIKYISNTSISPFLVREKTNYDTGEMCGGTMLVVTPGQTDPVTPQPARGSAPTYSFCSTVMLYECPWHVPVDAVGPFTSYPIP